MKLDELFHYIQENFGQLNAERELAKAWRPAHQVASLGMGFEAKEFLQIFSAMHSLGALLVLRAYVGSTPHNIFAELMGTTYEMVARRRKPFSKNSAALLQAATKALDQRGFVDFSYVDNGGNAIVIQGTRRDGSTAALRFIGRHRTRPKSIAVLPGEDSILLPQDQQIEVLPFANERAPWNSTGEESRIWAQRLIYVLALLHGEGKFYWRLDDGMSGGEGNPLADIHPFNIVRWQDTIWVSDADQIHESANAREISSKIIRPLLKKYSFALDVPADDHIIATEHFAVLNGGGKRAADKICAWATREGLHTIDLPGLFKKKDCLLVVDLAKERDGRRLAIDMRAALKSKGPASSSIPQVI